MKKSCYNEYSKLKVGCFIMKRRKWLGAAALVCALVGGFTLETAATAKQVEKASAAISLAQKDNIVATAYQAETKMTNAPTVVLDLASKKIYDKLVKTEKTPSNVVLRMNKDQKIVDAKGGEIGDFLQIFNNTLRGKMVPVVYVSNEEEADALVGFLSDKKNILDLCVASDKPELVGRVRGECENIRGVVFFNEYNDLYKDIVVVANKNKANVVVLPQSLATAQAVSYLQARCKTVWVTPETTKKIDVYDVVGSGAYGVVTTDTATAFSAMESFEEKSYPRMPFITAHRGMPNKVPENSVIGVKKAIEAGATHIELDVKVTSDNQLIVMHDDTIDRTTSGTGKTEEMTLAEIRQHTLLVCGEVVPTLDDFIKAIKEENSDLILNIEVKTLKSVAAADLVYADLVEHDFLHQAIVCGPGAAETIKRHPEIVGTVGVSPANGELSASLITLSQANAAIEVNGRLEYVSSARDKGYMLYSWNYGAFNLDPTIKTGVSGICTDDADFTSDWTRFVWGEEGQVKTLKKGDKIALKGVTCDKEQKDLEGKVFYLTDKGSYYEVIASYTENDMVRYTEKFKVKHDGNRGCGGVVGLELPVTVALSAAAVGMLKKRNCK